MTAAEIHELMPDIDVKLIRGCIQTMVKVSLIERIGASKPYLYKVARPLKQKLRGYENVMAVSKAQQIRDWLNENGPANNSEVANGLILNPKECSKSLFDMRKRGYVSRSHDGYFTLICDPEPVQAMSESEKREAERIKSQKRRDRAKLISARTPSIVKRKPKAIRVVDKKESKEFSRIQAQSVEDWLKAGGVIDRSPTIPKFERLTKDDIASGFYRSHCHSHQRISRSYLAW